MWRLLDALVVTQRYRMLCFYGSTLPTTAITGQGKEVEDLTPRIKCFHKEVTHICLQLMGELVEYPSPMTKYKERTVILVN